MPKKQRKYADDGWAIWVEGDDTSTVYMNDWLNPKGKSYVDIGLRIRGIKSSKALYMYVPFTVDRDEIEDVSLCFDDTRILQATFSATCIVDYKKNKHTTEIAYNGKTIDIVHLSTIDYQLQSLADGTLMSIDFEQLQPYIDNDEAYFIWRMPHRSLNEIFKPHVNMGNILSRLRDLITTPVVSEKFGYSVRVNESRLLPEEITRMGAFHRQKMKKAVITISIHEDYELNDSGCYRIHRLEENLYEGYLPKDYNCHDIITYQWQQNRAERLKGHFSFYYTLSKNYVSRGSMFLYMVLLIAVSVLGDLIANVVWSMKDMFN